MKVAVAPSLPPALRWYGRGFDDLQFWLIDRYVAMRHQEHKVFARFQAEHFPDREEGARITGDAFPVMRAQGTGVPAWTLPHVAIIDGGGLSDYVIARTPLRPGKRREMAHDRRPPPGYVESFRPNVDVSAGEVRVHEREVALTADEIRALEARWRAWIDSQGR
jgi:arabinofuranosyltransferase